MQFVLTEYSGGYVDAWTETGGFGNSTVYLKDPVLRMKNKRIKNDGPCMKDIKVRMRIANNHYINYRYIKYKYLHFSEVQSKRCWTNRNIRYRYVKQAPKNDADYM